MISEKASNACGIAGTICFCIQLIPQIIYQYRRRNCEGLPPIMMFLWVISSTPFSIYFCISTPNIILQIQPHLFMLFCSISYIQTLYYPPVQMNRLKICIIMATIILVDAGMEIGFILWLKPLYEKGTTWPDLIFGILAAVLLAVGLLPPYFELAKRQGRVVGINFWFLFVDSLGAYLSIISVVVGTMDVVGIILYCIIAFMELGIFSSHFIWCCRFKWLGNGKHLVEEDILSLAISNNEKQDEEMPYKSNNTSVKQIKEVKVDLNGHDDDNDDTSSYMEDFEMNSDVEYGEASTTVHTIHGIAMQNASSSTGSIKI